MKKFLIENLVLNQNQYAGIEPYDSVCAENCVGDYIEAKTAEEAIDLALDYLVELIAENGFTAKRDEESITVYDAEGKVIEYNYCFTATEVNDMEADVNA